MPKYKIILKAISTCTEKDLKNAIPFLLELFDNDGDEILVVHIEKVEESVKDVK